jgi:hypothetical protein
MHHHQPLSDLLLQVHAEVADQQFYVACTFPISKTLRPDTGFYSFAAPWSWDDIGNQVLRNTAELSIRVNDDLLEVIHVAKRNSPHLLLGKFDEIRITWNNLVLLRIVTGTLSLFFASQFHR